MPSQQRKLNNTNLIFLHIPKNGGTTLHSIIERKYPASAIFDIKVVNNTALNTDDFIALSTKDRTKIKVLKGHMIFGLHNYLDDSSKYITFLRQPEERLLSFYNYVKKRPHHRLYDSIFGNNLSFYDFVTTIDAGDIHNAQIRWISGLEHGTEAEMLEKALRNIDTHFSFVGLLEQYNASLVMLSKLYGWGVPYYKHKNKGTYEKTNLLLDEKTRKAIAVRNAGDMALYKIIAERLKKQKYRALPLELMRLQLINKVLSSYKLKPIKKLLGINQL